MKVRPRLEVASEPSLPIGRRYSVPPDVPPPDIDGWVLVRLGLRKSGVKVRLEKKMNTVWSQNQDGKKYTFSRFQTVKFSGPKTQTRVTTGPSKN